MEAGILAIWNDCDAAVEAEYERWYVGEHLAERVGVPGFRFGRRYQAVRAEVRYFTFYETDAPLVLRGRAYLDRLDHPTPATRRLMGHFHNMSRTVCRKTSHAGSAMAGAHALTVQVAAGAAGSCPKLVARTGRGGRGVDACARRRRRAGVVGGAGPEAAPRPRKRRCAPGPMPPSLPPWWSRPCAPTRPWRSPTATPYAGSPPAPGAPGSASMDCSAN